MSNNLQHDASDTSELRRVGRFNLSRQFPVGDFRVVWNYDNRLVVEQKSLIGRWLFYKLETDVFCLCVTSDTFESGLSNMRDIWNPRVPETVYNTKEMLLEQVDSLVSSVVKKNKQNTLTKYDFCAVYFADRWRAYYPTVQQLIEYHTKVNTEETVNKSYLDFLTSQDFKNIRALWDNEPNITIPSNE
jgi:hypothetical protein